MKLTASWSWTQFLVGGSYQKIKTYGTYITLNLGFGYVQLFIDNVS